MLLRKEQYQRVYVVSIELDGDDEFIVTKIKIIKHPQFNGELKNAMAAFVKEGSEIYTIFAWSSDAYGSASENYASQNQLIL